MTLSQALKYICDISLSLQHFPTPWQQAAIVSNYGPISLQRNFCNLFEIVVYEHVSRYFKHKLNSCHCGFLKYKYTFTNLLICLNYLYPLTSYRRQVDVVYFNLSVVF